MWLNHSPEFEGTLTRVTLCTPADDPIDSDKLDKIGAMKHGESCREWLKVWKRRGIRAPHKPLLMLVALRSVLENEERQIAFVKWDERLRPLLRKYTVSKSLHTEYPFWRLQRDGIWEVSGGDALVRRKSNTDPLKSKLLEHNIRGGFKPSMFDTLKGDSAFRSDFIAAMLRHFPELVPEELLRDVGLVKDSPNSDRQT